MRMKAWVYLWILELKQQFLQLLQIISQSKKFKMLDQNNYSLSFLREERHSSWLHAAKCFNCFNYHQCLSWHSWWAIQNKRRDAGHIAFAFSQNVSWIKVSYMIVYVSDYIEYVRMKTYIVSSSQLKICK